MSTFSSEAIRGFPFATAEDVAVQAPPVDIEIEVIQLFDRYRDPLCRYILSFSLPLQDGEEIVQEVFLALFQHLRADKSRRNLPGWIFRVGHNLALKRRTSNQRSQVSMEAESDLVRNQADSSPDPEARVLMAQRQTLLLAAVHALPQQDQCCLRLRAEGLRYREIAGVLGISLGSVSMSLARSMARLLRIDMR